MVMGRVLVWVRVRVSVRVRVKVRVGLRVGDVVWVRVRVKIRFPGRVRIRRRVMPASVPFALCMSFSSVVLAFVALGIEFRLGKGFR